MASFLSLNEEAYTDIAKLGEEVSGQQNVASQISSSLEKEDFSQIYTTLYSVLDKVIEKGSESDAETYSLVLIDTLTKIENNGDKITQLANSLVGSQTRSTLRLKLIIHLLNAIESTNGQHFKLFIQALQYAKDTKQTDNVAKYASVIEQMLNEWNAAVVDRRRVYSLFFDILSESQQSEAANEVLIKYLSSYTQEKDLTDETLDYAAKAVSNAIKTLYSFEELNSLVAVQQLAKKNAPVYELVKIFANGTLSDYLKYAQSNQEVITKQLNLDHNDLINKMRLLTLSTLAGSATGPIAYATISKELNIDENDVESYVIRAVGNKYIDAKLNQLARTVSVNKALHREYTAQEWNKLSVNVSQWQKTVDQMLQTVRTKKDQAFVEPPKKK